MNEILTGGPTVLFVTNFSLALARVSGFGAACPVIFPNAVPTLVRAGVSAILALLFTVIQPELANPESPSLAMLSEIGIGAALGLTVRCACAAVQFAGDLIDGQIGFGFAKHFSPLSSDDVGPMQHLFYLVVMILFSVCGGFEAFVRGLALSFRWFPLGRFVAASVWTTHLTDRVGAIMDIGLRVGLPVILALTATQIALALMTRIAPTLNIWSLGFALTLVVGFFACWLFTPTLVEDARLVWQEHTDGALVWEN